MKKLIYPIVIIGIVFIFFAYRFYSDAIHYAMSPEADRVVIDVLKGSTAQDVAQTLQEKGLIKSPAVFSFYLKQKGLSGKIKAGRMVLQTNYTLPKIIETLIEGRSEEMSVTILEGWTVQQIADHLESIGLTTAEEFMDCVRVCDFEGKHLPDDYLEGYLYPDTYFVNPGSFSPKRFIQRMINTFESKLDNYIWIGLEKENRTLEELVIMASIVEREERDPDERPTVAGILWNRFDEGAGLGADATVLYALGRTKGGLTYDDLQIDSPYNTRKYRGLPPTPIGNPSIESLKAAVHPTLTDYWYYLHDSEGQVHYARTLEEHNANKRKYIQ